MNQTAYTPSTWGCARSSYTVLKASGAPIRAYLQGQITQDIQALTPQHPIYTAVLTPQGKMVADMFIVDGGEELILITATSYALALVERLRRYALGQEIRLGIVDTLGLLSIQGDDSSAWIEHIQAPIVATISMPEAAAHGDWLIMQISEIEPTLASLPCRTTDADMELAAIAHGTPRFGRDWDASTHPMNANLVEMKGVSFEKGCYVGQEVTSRMQWRGGIKKKLYRVHLSSIPEQLPCPIQTSINIGSLTSAASNTQGECMGIAHLPIESVESKQPLSLPSGESVTVIEPCHASH